jgi:hypothetical protein
MDRVTAACALLASATSELRGSMPAACSRAASLLPLLLLLLHLMLLLSLYCYSWCCCAYCPPGSWNSALSCAASAAMSSGLRGWRSMSRSKRWAAAPPAASCSLRQRGSGASVCQLQAVAANWLASDMFGDTSTTPNLCLHHG